MDKEKILERYKEIETKMWMASMLDKVEIAEKTGKIQATDFLDTFQKDIAKRELKLLHKEISYFSFGGVKQAEREMFFFLPNKKNNWETEKEQVMQEHIAAIRIQLPKEEYEHRQYLGGILKLGVERKKIGDIVVQRKEADILVARQILEFLLMQLPSLTRFKTASIQEIPLEQVREKTIQMVEKRIQISSNRLDAIVAELANTSRSKAVEIIQAERVWINGKVEKKLTKTIEPEDTITIRRIGKFIYKQEEGKTKSGRIKVLVLKYC